MSESETQAAALDQSVTAQVVWKWFNDHMPGSPVSQHVEAWNHLHVQLPKLIAALEAVQKP